MLLEGEKFASIVKEQVIKVEFYTNVIFAKELVKCLEKLKLKTKLKKCKWNVNNVRDLDTLVVQNVQFVEGKRLQWNLEIWNFRFKKEWKEAIKLCLKDNLNKD